LDAQRWEHSWQQDDCVVQPALTVNGNILLNTGGAKGLRQIAVGHGTDGWTFEEHWTSVQLRSTYSDFVVHKGHAFGYDGLLVRNSQEMVAFRLSLVSG